MANMACFGSLVVVPILIGVLGGDYPALYPALDMFMAPFLAKMAMDIDEVLVLQQQQQEISWTALQYHHFLRYEAKDLIDTIHYGNHIKFCWWIFCWWLHGQAPQAFLGCDSLADLSTELSRIDLASFRESSLELDMHIRLRS